MPKCAREGPHSPIGSADSPPLMMSSEEDTECLLMQERLLKKNKRTRQRVDAGEPRNSYASIPNFSSRPQLFLNNGYGLLASPPLATDLGSSILSSGSSNNGEHPIGDGASAASVNGKSLSSASSAAVANSSGFFSGEHLARQHHHRHHHHRSHHRSGSHLHHSRLQSPDMCSDGEGGQSGSRDGEGCLVNGSALVKEGDPPPPLAGASSSSASEESSHLLREILQGGGASAKSAISSEVNGNGRNVGVGGDPGSPPLHGASAYLLSDGKIQRHKSSIISHILKNGSHAAAAASSSVSGLNNGLSATKDVGGNAPPATGTLVRGSPDECGEPEVECSKLRETPRSPTLETRSKMNGGSVAFADPSVPSPESPGCCDAEDDDDDDDKSEATAVASSATNSTACAVPAALFSPSQAGVGVSASAAGATGSTAASHAPSSASSSSSSSSVLVLASDVDLKRARVENIISSMRSSPSRPGVPELPQVNGCKKRKLYLPQQHESKASASSPSPPSPLHLRTTTAGGFDGCLEQPAPKQRRTDQNLLRQQLSQMQAQIAAIQQKLDSYDPQNSSDSDVLCSPRPSDDGQPVEVARPPVRPESDRRPTPIACSSPLIFHLGYIGGAGRDHRIGGRASKSPPTPDLEPAHFIDEARRMVSEQERLSKEADSCKSATVTSVTARPVSSPATTVEPKVAATAAAAGPVPRTPYAVIPPDWERLADSLKVGMSSLIDDWVRRCATKPGGGRNPAAAIAEGPKNPCPATASVVPLPPPISSSSMLTCSTSSSGGAISSSMAAAACISSSVATSMNSMLHLGDRRSPRTKVIDRGRMGGLVGPGQGAPGMSASAAAAAAAVSAALFSSSSHFGELHIKSPMTGLFPPPKPPMPMYVPHPPLQPPHPLAFYGHGPHGGGGHLDGAESPEQSEALPLVVTPKKKRHKVTDTRITPRTVSRLLGQQENMMESKYSSLMGGGASPIEGSYHHHPPPIVPVSLPTSVAIPNPSLHQSDVFSPYPYYHPSHHARGSPQSDVMDDSSLFHPSHPHHQALHSSLLLGGHSSPEPIQLSSRMKTENGDSSDCNSGDMLYDGSLPISSTLTPMHLRKAKLMFFYVRYPSSAILKTYFPDIKFNKNNTAQLVKWFSNFREFYYIQMEKYARQAMSEGCKAAEDLTVTLDSELYRVLNLHYNRNNHIEVPTTFRFVVEQTLREFFKAIVAGKDTEQSWKKSIYKVIARMDDNLPDYFKSPNFLEQLE